jgi:hypothetical protein
VTAAWNPTGETWIGQLIVLPRLVFATIFAMTIVVIGLLFPLAWTQQVWLARLRMEPALRRRPRR